MLAERGEIAPGQSWFPGGPGLAVGRRVVRCLEPPSPTWDVGLCSTLALCRERGQLGKFCGLPQGT